MKLSVYELGSPCSGVACANKVLRPLGTGIYHCGVVVYDEEWSYADMIAPVAMQTGIFCCAPRQCDLAVTFKDSIPMGTTSYAKSAILGLIAKLEVEWLSRDYDYLKRNCNHFCNFFCQQIGVGAVPSWTLNLATVGSSLKEQECSSVLCCSNAPTLQAVDFIDGRPVGTILVGSMPVLSQEAPCADDDHLSSQACRSPSQSTAGPRQRSALQELADSRSCSRGSDASISKNIWSI